MSLLSSSLFAVNMAHPTVSLADTVSATSATLVSAPGQYVPVLPVKVLDTRDGTGGVATQPLAAGATATYTVANFGEVPAAGDFSDAYVVISAFSPQVNGCLSDYDSDLSDPDICTASFQAGQNTSDSDIVHVSSAGSVSVTNESSGSADVSVTVMGYYQANDPVTLDTPDSGDTYVPLPLQQIVDTRSGLGAPDAEVPAGGSLTVQVTGSGGVPADAAGAALFVGAANASAPGWVSAFPSDGSDPGLRMLSYTPSRTVHNLYFGALSAAGQLTLVNEGSVPVDLLVGVQGYLVDPDAGEAGSTYQDVAQSRIADTRFGTGGITSTPVPAGGSITFAATGIDGVPSAGVSSVAESVAALNPAVNGFLSVYPTGTQDPGEPGVNFDGGDQQDNDMATPVLTAVSSAGSETVTNHSSDTVDIVVSLRGYYSAATVPQAPDSVSVSVSGSTAAVTWDPPEADGGAAITSYTVTASPDGVTATVDGSSTQATLSGLANPSTDLFTVTAANAVGDSMATTYSPPNVITGTVLAPDGVTPVAGDVVTVYPDAESDSTPSVLGTTTTDEDGNWAFSVPQYADLPADAQAVADSNAGWLNLDVVSFAYASAEQIPVVADASRSAWVGTSTQSQDPDEVIASPEPLSTLHPDNPDSDSPSITEAQAAASYVAVNNPAVSDASGNATGNPNYAYPSVPTDQFGYQESGGDNSYNPNIAPDGTDVTHATITPATSNTGCGTPPIRNFLRSRESWTIVGEFHSNWDDMGSVSYTASANSNIGVEAGVSASVFTADGTHKVSNGSGLSLGKGNDGTFSSHQLQLYMQYDEFRLDYYTIHGVFCDSTYKWEPEGVVRSPGGTLSREGPGMNDNQNKAKTRWRSDGCIALVNLWAASIKHHALNQYWLADTFPEPGFGLTHDKGKTYGFAAGISWTTDAGINVSLAFSAETDHSVETEQKVEFDDSNGMNTGPNHTAPTREDPWPPFAGQVDTKHFFWGSNGPLNLGGTSQPKTFYNC